MAKHVLNYIIKTRAQMAVVAPLEALHMYYATNKDCTEEEQGIIVIYNVVY